MPARANATNTAGATRKPAGATLPKGPAKRPVYPHTAPTQAVNTDDIESDEAVSSEDEDEDEDDGEEAATEAAPTINMLISGPIEDDEDDDSDASFVDDEPSKAPTKKSTDAAMAAAAKRLKIDGQKPGATLPNAAPRGPLPERATIHADELEGSEESDEAEDSGDESMDDEDDNSMGHESGPETSNLTHLLLGGSASGNEDSDDDGEWPQPSRKGAKTRSLTKGQSQARMEIDS